MRVVVGGGGGEVCFVCLFSNNGKRGVKRLIRAQERASTVNGWDGSARGGEEDGGQLTRGLAWSDGSRRSRMAACVEY